ncbi:hypothetical protein TNCV_4165691 [Trichonephila clavipes]|nr:hypothetical protein TNCV_4165691 [Trichonephila clavipes]
MGDSKTGNTYSRTCSACCRTWGIRPEDDKSDEESGQTKRRGKIEEHVWKIFTFPQALLLGEQVIRNGAPAHFSIAVRNPIHGIYHGRWILLRTSEIARVRDSSG